MIKNIIAAVAIVSLAISSASCQKGDRPGSKKSSSLDAAKEFYSWNEVSKGVWRIDEHGQVNAYLVIGGKRAALVDTGEGEPGLSSIAAALTSLPIIVVNTHFHQDHAGGDSAFPTIYIDGKELELVRGMASPKAEILPLKDGDAIDLGGRSLSVIETPGHTAGSVCLLDAANRILFSGDNDNAHVWLFLDESLSVQEYLASLERLMARSGEYDLILPGHGDPCNFKRLERIAEACRAILKGGVDAKPYKNYDALSFGPPDALVAYRKDKIRSGR